MKKIKKFIFPILLILCLVAGTIWQSAMTQIEKSKYCAVGNYVDLGAYQAHYYSKGSGDTAFVFITGSGTPCAYTDFYALQNMLSAKGQTVTFDHAGSGWSSNANSPRTIENMTNELTVLIDTVAPNKPIVIICHSLGSLEAIQYTQTNPEKRTIGLNRLMGELGCFLPVYGENSRNKNLPEIVKDIDKEMFYRFAGNADSINTINLINENATTVLKGPLLGDVPILVLSSDGGDDWNKVQIQLASWSENSEQVMLKKSEHYLYWSNYEQVSDCIESFIEKISC
ncbi:MAG: alpha/beta hydrolase [Clostridiales bacterium]|nr:alpha/beta hydrolase [Clostridiales bacterium]